MDTSYFHTGLGYFFVCLTAIFALGLTPRFARYFYPGAPAFLRRLAAPVIFAVLAMTCFQGKGIQVLALVVVLGMTQIILSQRTNRRQKLKH